MRTNFQIKSFTEINFLGRHIDLHNNFTFRPIRINPTDTELKIQFDKSDGDWVPDDEFNKLTFTFNKINYCKTIDPDPKYISDDNSLAGITYFNSDDRDENYGLIDKSVPNLGDDIIFTFESDRVIRVNCDELTLTAE
jgi:hypothetical protein